MSRLLTPGESDLSVPSPVGTSPMSLSPSTCTSVSSAWGTLSVHSFASPVFLAIFLEEGTSALRRVEGGLHVSPPSLAASSAFWLSAALSTATALSVSAFSPGFATLDPDLNR